MQQILKHANSCHSRTSGNNVVNCKHGNRWNWGNTYRTLECSPQKGLSFGDDVCTRTSPQSICKNVGGIAPWNRHGTCETRHLYRTDVCPKRLEGSNWVGQSSRGLIAELLEHVRTYAGWRSQWFSTIVEAHVVLRWGARSPAENFIQSVFQKHRNLERQATPDQLRKPG